MSPFKNFNQDIPLQTKQTDQQSSCNNSIVDDDDVTADGGFSQANYRPILSSKITRLRAIGHQIR